MCDSFFVTDRKGILAIAVEWHLWQQRHPLNFIAGQFGFCGYAVERGAVERAVFRIIAAKETRIDNHAMNDSWEPKTNDAPIDPWRTSTTRLPPVHPLATIGILPLNKDG